MHHEDIATVFAMHRRSISVNNMSIKLLKDLADALRMLCRCKGLTNHSKCILKNFNASMYFSQCTLLGMLLQCITKLCGTLALLLEYNQLPHNAGSLLMMLHGDEWNAFLVNPHFNIWVDEAIDIKYLVQGHILLTVAGLELET